MAVIAALDRKRQAQPKSAEHVGRPRTERQHGNWRVDRPFRRLNAPLRTIAVKRAGVALEHKSAQRRKARRIGSGHSERIADAPGLAPKNGMAEDWRQRRLKSLHAIGIEHLMRQAELGREL